MIVKLTTVYLKFKVSKIYIKASRQTYFNNFAEIKQTFKAEKLFSVKILQRSNKILSFIKFFIKN